ncbi:MAG TPA: alpha/beta fold hydrolase [Vicinamibacterales bacterium]|nr:alpha/beta fold hydrolase [Vicinamibacterales bacterium]
MPVFQNGPARCFYRVHGEEDRPPLFLSHSLGQDHGMWDAQAEALAPHFRVVRYDIRGHGASGVTPGDYAVADLGQDVLRLADEIGITRFAFCGLSLGGMIAQWLAANAPTRVTAIVLANTSPLPGFERMERRRQTVLASGMAAVADEVMGRFFSPAHLAGGGPAVAEARRTLLATDPVGYAGACAAVRDMDLTGVLPRIQSPALIIDGEHDVSLPWKGHGDALAAGLPHATVVRLSAAHLSNLERPRSFTAAVVRFLLAAHDHDSYADGLEVRRRILGDAHVDRASASPASAAFQELITRYAWGSIWTRPGLDIRTRRLLVLAMTAALGRWEEFRLHLRTGFASELEWCDLEEVLLQAAIYAGVPVANTGFQHAAEERAAHKT